MGTFSDNQRQVYIIIKSLNFYQGPRYKLIRIILVDVVIQVPSKPRSTDG